jgi:hypothetical protein
MISFDEFPADKLQFLAFRIPGAYHNEIAHLAKTITPTVPV